MTILRFSFLSFSLLTYLLTRTFVYFFLILLQAHKRTTNTIGFHGTICDTRHLLV